MAPPVAAALTEAKAEGTPKATSGEVNGNSTTKSKGNGNGVPPVDDDVDDDDGEEEGGEGAATGEHSMRTCGIG